MNKLYTKILSVLELIKWSVAFIRHHKKIKKNRINPQRPLAIIGNGPSLKIIINSENWEKYDCCVVNDSILTDFFWKLKPLHYFLIDDQYFAPTEVQFEENNRKLKERFKDIDWEINIYIPVRYKSKASELITDNKFINLNFFNSIPLSDQFLFKTLKFYLFKRSMANPVFMNVCNAALFIMINKGYENIYLFGQDRSWISQIYVDEDNYVCLGGSNHYYQDNQQDGMRLVLEGRPIRLHEYLRNMAIGSASFWEIREYADYLGNVLIINKTKGSFIDAFQKEE